MDWIKMDSVDHKMTPSPQGLVDIGYKSISKRRAEATSKIIFSPQAFKKMLEVGSMKGDIFESAKLAGIMAAKHTAQLLPYCHPLALTHVAVGFDLLDAENAVCVQVCVEACAQTGVEMEALTAASVAALCIYDMTKAFDKGAVIEKTQLLSKSGGKSGDYRRN